VDPDGEDVPAGQLAQRSKPVLPLGESEFTGQFMHVLDAGAPTTAEYLPASQSTQELAAEAPGVSEYFPAAAPLHVAAAEAPGVSEYFPAVQSTQELAAEAPGVSEYFPGIQSLQLVAEEAPTVGLYFPTAQSEHEEPASEYLPAAQATQAVDVVDPDGEDVPAMQLEHTSEPTTALYFASAQAVHVPLFGPVYPRLQEHCVDKILAVPTVLEKDAQDKQPEFPTRDLYLPAPQAAHACPSAPTNPALHLQLTWAMLPAAELEFTGHLLHSEEPAPAYVLDTQSRHMLPLEARTVPEYFPAEHAEHTEAVAAEKNPAAQVLQVEDAARENVPLAQPEHGLLPTVDLNIPATQFKQTVFAEELQVASYDQ
jgi:hypothetical protein